MTNHERIKHAFGDITAPERFADKILKNPINAYRKPRYRRPVLFAAVITISLLMFGTAALAYTGVLSGVFSAVTGGTGDDASAFGGFGTDTRQAIVEHEYVAVSELPPASINDDGSVLELIAYYADSKELWFNFILSNADIPDHWDVGKDHLLPGFFSMEIVEADGTVSKFEKVIDENSEHTTFPGGYSFVDRTRGTLRHKTDDNSQTFSHYTTASVIDDGSLDITVIVVFGRRNAPVGETVYLQIGNFMFKSVEFPPGEIPIGVYETFDSEMFYGRWTIHRTMSNIYEFEIEIDSRFIEIESLRYIAANAEEAAQMGITIHDVTVTPTATRVEVTIDISKNNIMNADYAVILDNIDFGNGNPPVPPENLSHDKIMSLMNLNIYAISDTGEYTQSMGVNGSWEENIIKGWWEFGSMFFDAPENLTLIFETRVYRGEYTKEPVSIPLVLVG